MGFCGIKVTGREQPRKAAPRRKAERRAGHGDGARALTEGGARGRRGRRGTGKRVVLFMKKMGAMQKHLGRRPEMETQPGGGDAGVPRQERRDAAHEAQAGL